MQYSVMQLASGFPDDYLKQVVCRTDDLFTCPEKDVFDFLKESGGYSIQSAC